MVAKVKQMTQLMQAQAQCGTLSVERASSNSSESLDVINCFTSGTTIATLRGKIQVEDLRDCDKVLTRDRGFQPILWRGNRQIDFTCCANASKHRPVLLRAGSLGPGQPERDMLISPRHRLLTTNSEIMSHLGEHEALIEAQALVGQPGIDYATPHAVTYHHLLFDRHEVILSDNIWSESFFMSRLAAQRLISDQAAELTSIYPQLNDANGAAFHAPARVCAEIIPLIRA